jgi:hypothetical protein
MKATDRVADGRNQQSNHRNQGRLPCLLKIKEKINQINKGNKQTAKKPKQAMAKNDGQEHQIANQQNYHAEPIQYVTQGCHAWSFGASSGCGGWFNRRCCRWLGWQYNLDCILPSPLARIIIA